MCMLFPNLHQLTVFKHLYAPVQSSSLSEDHHWSHCSVRARNSLMWGQVTASRLQHILYNFRFLVRSGLGTLRNHLLKCLLVNGSSRGKDNFFSLPSDGLETSFIRLFRGLHGLEKPVATSDEQLLASLLPRPPSFPALLSLPPQEWGHIDLCFWGCRPTALAFARQFAKMTQ